jgi:hypothetical protein
MMQSTLRLLGAVALVGFCGAPAFAQSGLAGAWELTIDSPAGANTANLDLTLAGETLSGMLASPIGSVPVTGQATATTATFAADIDAQGMALHLDFSGTLENDALKGNVKVGDFGEFAFTGKRRPATAAAASATAAAAAPASTAAPSAGAASGLAGTWDVVFTIEGMGDMPATVTFTVDGQNVVSDLSSAAGNVRATGTFDGTTLKLDATAETPQGPVPMTITGELTPAGLSGSVSFAGMMEAPWKGTRK